MGRITYIKPLKMVPSWNLWAIINRLRGSVDTPVSRRIEARVLTPDEHTADPSCPSRRQKPKYPIRTSSLVVFCVRLTMKAEMFEFV